MKVSWLAGLMLAYSPLPSVWTPGANQYVWLGSLKSTVASSPAATVIAPSGTVAGPSRMDESPHTLAGGVSGACGLVVAACPAFGTKATVCTLLVQAARAATTIPVTVTARLIRATRR